MCPFRATGQVLWSRDSFLTRTRGFEFCVLNSEDEMSRYGDETSRSKNEMSRYSCVKDDAVLKDASFPFRFSCLSFPSPTVLPFERGTECLKGG